MWGKNHKRFANGGFLITKMYLSNKKINPINPIGFALHNVKSNPMMVFGLIISIFSRIFYI